MAARAAQATVRVGRPEERSRPAAKTAAARRPRLRPVARRRPFLVPFILTVGALLVVTLALPAAVNLAVLKAQAAYTGLEQRQQEIQAEMSDLTSVAAGLTAAPRVREQAERLGLGPASRVLYLEAGPMSAEQPLEGIRSEGADGSVAWRAAGEARETVTGE